MGKTTVAQLVKFIEAEVKRQGYGQDEFARRAGVGQSTMSRIIAGKSAPRMESIDKIAQALGYSTISFLLLASGAISEFQNVELTESFQALGDHDRQIVLNLVHSLEKVGAR